MKKSFWAPITLALAAYLVLPLPGLSAPLSQRSSRSARRSSTTRQKEGVLSTTIQGFKPHRRAQGRDQGHRSSASAACRRASTARRPSCSQVRDRLEAARDRLERLRSELATARRVLAARLVEIYKADSPDALTVILEADGFGDLLERAEFLDRISDQDRQITDRVRGLRDRRAAPGHPARRPRAARAARRRADPPRARPDRLGRRTSSWRRATSSPRRAPTSRGALAQVRDEQRRARGRPRLARGGAGARGSPRSRAPAAGLRGPVKQGSGQLIWPVNGPVVSPLRRCAGAVCTRASTSPCPTRHADPRRRLRPRGADGLGRRLRQLHLHPAHRAACPPATATSPASRTSNGASVTQGQVIGYAGCTGPLLRGRTCTSRRASTGRRSTRWATSSLQDHRHSHAHSH